jgi:hypothetical protein
MKRSAFGRGIIAAKLDLPMDSNPFELGHWKYDDWIAGYKAVKEKTFGDMEKHGIYESGIDRLEEYVEYQKKQENDKKD